MAKKYKLSKDLIGNGKPSITRITDGASIPVDVDNADYAEYLEWVAEGNTADAAD
tara:strand:+ start:1238 stop:1402 length:165 start_codon:yes stop_codon:yes gene_type:complete